MDLNSIKSFAKDARKELLKTVSLKIESILREESLERRESPQAIKYLELLSGRRHRVSTAFNLYFKNKIDSLRVVTSIVKMKRLTETEIKSYIETNEWKGKAGAYGIQGSAEKFIQFISGSYTNIVGLPLNQVYGSLNSIGYFNEN